MIKLICRRARLLLLASMLIGAMSGAFNSTNTIAQEIEIFQYGDGGGGGGALWVCPDSSTCGNFGCHARSTADPTQVCSRWLLEGATGSCPSPVNCTSR